MDPDAVSRLLQEIRTRIIADHPEDPAALSALNSIDQQLNRTPGQYDLRHITISQDQPEAKCEHLKMLLEETPSLRQSVRELTLKESSMSGSWLYEECPKVLELLPLLTSLETIRIEGPPPLLRWPSIPLSTQIAVYDLMAQPHIETIHLTQISSIDLIPIAQYYHLKALVLTTINVPPFETLGACFPLNAPPAGSEKPHLEVFRVHTCGTALQVFAQCAKHSEATSDLFQPTKMSLSTDSFVATEMEAGWNDMLDHCTANITWYAVKQDPTLLSKPGERDTPIPNSFFAVRKMPNLTLLNVSVHSQLFEEKIEDAFPALIEELDLLSKNPSELAEMGIYVDFSSLRQLRDVEEQGEDLDISERVSVLGDHKIWSRLEEILARETFFQLKELKVGLDITGCILPEDAWEVVKKHMLAQMPVLSARNVVKTVLGKVLYTAPTVIGYFV